MMDSTYPLYPIIAFLGFFLCLIPLPWHLYSGNSGTCYYIMWACLACLNQFVNSVVWAGNAVNSAPAWCEISIRIMLGASVGVPAASLCINRRLYHIASIQTVSRSHAEKRRAILVDTLICVVFPLVFVALQYVVQGHRFDIYENIGCYPALYNTLPTYFLSNIWPIIIGLISAVYCVLSLRAFVARRAQFAQLLSAHASLTVGRYFRLMALAMTDIVLTVPLSSFLIWLNVTATPISPWISWEDTHFNYSRVESIPALFWHQNRLLVIAVEFTRWTTPFCALIFFAYFGFAEEARKNYRRISNAILKRLGYSTGTKQSPLPSWSIGRFKKPKDTSFPDSATTPSTMVQLSDIKRAHSLVSSRTLNLSTSTPPAYSPSQSTFHCKGKQENFPEFLSDTQSEITRYEHSPDAPAEVKTTGSYAHLPMPSPTTVEPFTADDLTLPTPTTAVSSSPHLAFHIPPLDPRPVTPPTTFLPPLPITPPPENPRRLRELLLVPTSPRRDRPLTFPSFEAASPRSVQPPPPFTL